MADALTPAGELREAARVMRERAGAATPGPWSPADPHLECGHRVESSDHRDWVAWTGDHDEENSAADAAHLASWHPSVALAVADWLAAAAAHALAGGDGCPGCVPYHALSVARAYLGSKEAEGG